jgi:hypothetical protein
MGHIADGIDVDEESYAGDDEDHDAGERVQEITPIRDKWNENAGRWNRTRGDPFEKNLLKNALVGIERQESENGAGSMKEGEENAADTEKVDRRLRKQAADEKHERRGNKWKERNEPEMSEEIVGGGHRRGPEERERGSSGKTGPRHDRVVVEPATI